MTYRSPIIVNDRSLVNAALVFMCEAAFTASPVLQFLFLGGFPGMRLLRLRALVSQGSALRIFKTQERLQNALFELLETKELDQMLQSALAF